MTANMNPGMPNLAEQQRAREAVVQTLMAGALMLDRESKSKLNELTDGSSEYERGLAAGIGVAAARLTHQANKTRTQAIL